MSSSSAKPQELKQNGVNCLTSSECFFSCCKQNICMAQNNCQKFPITHIIGMIVGILFLVFFLIGICSAIKLKKQKKQEEEFEDQEQLEYDIDYDKNNLSLDNNSVTLNQKDFLSVSDYDIESQMLKQPKNEIKIQNQLRGQVIQLNSQQRSEYYQQQSTKKKKLFQFQIESQSDKIRQFKQNKKVKKTKNIKTQDFKSLQTTNFQNSNSYLAKTQPTTPIGQDLIKLKSTDNNDLEDQFIQNWKKAKRKIELERAASDRPNQLVKEVSHKFDKYTDRGKNKSLQKKNQSLFYKRS